jgi:hypothetical protein
MVAAPLEVPPLEGWPVWHAQFRRRWEQGQHCLFVGPTGSGKTVACHTLAWDRKYVVVLGTKPADRSLQDYVNDGYYRTDHWPLSQSELRKATFDDGSVRIILWPKIVKREDLHRFRPTFVKCLDDIFVDVDPKRPGGWTIVADEGLWLSDRQGMDLGRQLSAIAYGGRSMGITLMMLIQRPAGVPRNTWSNATHGFLWKMGVGNDTREMALLSARDPKSVGAAIKNLPPKHFLYLPFQAADDWAVSKVDLAYEQARVAG